MRPLTDLLPDHRLPAVAELMVQGIVSSESPLITQIARGVAHGDHSIWLTSKRAYRFVSNDRFSHRTLRKGLYRIAQQSVQTQQPKRLVVAVDPVNFEKPYSHSEGISTVRKCTPPALGGEARLTRGYPAITASIVNLKQPTTTYAHWFSYQCEQFLSENHEIHCALRVSKALFSAYRLCFVADSGLDDRKVFQQVQALQAQFVIRAKHDRVLDVFNARLKRWEAGQLFDLAQTVPLQFTDSVTFTHARKTYKVKLGFGALQVRLRDTQHSLWVLVVHDVKRERDLILLSNVPLSSPRRMRQVYRDWRLRSRIEHGYRFDQEQGLDVQDMRVTTLERMRRLFILVLLAAQFVAYIHRTWTAQATEWLRRLGGALGLKQDRNGLYLLLRGMATIWLSAAALTFAQLYPFPTPIHSCG
ncbi:MAG: transposase [Chloroflexi bacterium]|nr:transposase [Chloroflexota bacterium]